MAGPSGHLQILLTVSFGVPICSVRIVEKLCRQCRLCRREHGCMSFNALAWPRTNDERIEIKWVGGGKLGW